MKRRATITVALALLLAAVDLWYKAATPTPPWAFHTRSTAWAALSFALLCAVLALTRVPSVAVAISAGVLAGGVVGNLVSGAVNSWAVPDPIVVAFGRGIAAFNLADVFVFTGILSLTAALAATVIHHRALLRPPRAWLRRG